MVLDDLILDDAHSRLTDGKLRQRDTLFVGGKRGCTEDGIHLLLCIGRKLLLCGTYTGERILQFFHAVDDLVFCGTHPAFLLTFFSLIGVSLIMLKF